MTPSYMTCCRSFTFDAAHHLPDYPGKCKNVHGHTWKLEVCFYGRVQPSGFLIDFSEIKTQVANLVLSKLDHTDLNDILENPTAEFLVRWIWDQLEFITPPEAVRLQCLRLWESADSYVSFKGY